MKNNLRKRKIAAQYTPYGIFTKESGGLGKSIQKSFVRADLMLNSKYDKRLMAEILENIKENKYFKKGTKVIVLGEEKGKIWVCPFTDDILNKRNINIEVCRVGK